MIPLFLQIDFRFFPQKDVYNEHMQNREQKSEVQRNRIFLLETQLKSQCDAYNELKSKFMELLAENDQLRRKIMFMDMNGGMELSTNFGMSRVPSTMTQMTGSNFGMEDEAGEEFSNTYLAELKDGVSQQSLEKFDKYSTKELQLRNSMVPQHLRGSYAVVNLDQSISEQEIKVDDKTLKI